MKTQSVSDEIWNLIRETQKNLRELSVSQRATDEQIKRFSVETDKLRDSQRATDEQIKRFSAELSASQKETDQSIKELSVSQKETDQSIKELSVSQKETDEQMKRTDEQMKRTDEQMKRTDEQMKRTDIRINKVVGDFGNRWGKLGENLVKGSLVKRLKERGIPVEKVITNAKNGDVEFDIIAINGREIVVVEVKATLDPLDVDEFLERIKKFKIHWPEFKEKTVYGAMAFLIRANKRADSLAGKRGFFVISATGDVVIENAKGFQPRVFD